MHLTITGHVIPESQYDHGVEHGRFRDIPPMTTWRICLKSGL